MNSHSTMLQPALQYANYGWHVFPLQPGGKQPLPGLKWRDMATADISTIQRWWTQYPTANIGLACGPSGLLVLDFDMAKDNFEGGDLLTKLRLEHPTAVQVTPSGGLHLLYKQPEGQQLGNGTGELPKGIDVRGDGGYIVLAPSVHPNGNRYAWQPNQPQPQPLPEFVLDLLKPRHRVISLPSSAPIRENGSHRAPAEHTDRTRPYARAALEGEIAKLAGTGEGRRNPQLYNSACNLFEFIEAGALDEDEVTRRLTTTAQETGLPDKEISATIASARKKVSGKPRELPELTTQSRQERDTSLQTWVVAKADKAEDNEGESAPAQSNKADEGDQKKTSKAKDLYLFAKERAGYFTAQDGRAYALCPVEGHQECYALNSRGFKGWLGQAYYTEREQWAGRDTRSEVAEMLEMDAKKTQRDVCTRAGRQGDKLYIDLGTAAWDAIEIDANGWRKISDPPVVFRRPSSMRAMPYPEMGGSIDLLAKYINAEPEDLPLIAAWAAYALCLDGPFPILAFTGEQGTAKSTSVRVLKKLIDPDTAELRSMPREERDLIVAASGQRLLSFDNVTTIDRTTADALCRIVTEGGFGKRANYTDDEEVTFKVKRPIVLNGIGDPVSANEDMMERAIIICPPVITDGKRRDEASFWAEFEQDKPKLLGFLLGVAVEGLAKLPTTTVSNLPRMADFTLFGVAAQDAYAPGGNFLQDYERNRTEANEIVIENSSVGEILRKIVLVSGGWKGTAAELLAKMNEHASEDERRSPGWPKAPNKVKQVLQRLATSLRKIGVGGVGIEYVKSNGTKHIVLTRL